MKNDGRSKNSLQFLWFLRPCENLVNTSKNKHFGIHLGALRAPWEHQSCENRSPVEARRVFRRSDQTGKRDALERHRDAPERPLGVRSETQRSKTGPFLEKYAWFSLKCAYSSRNGPFWRQRGSPKSLQKSIEKWSKNGPKKSPKKWSFYGVQNGHFARDILQKWPKPVW